MQSNYTPHKNHVKKSTIMCVRIKLFTAMQYSVEYPIEYSSTRQGK